MAIDKTGEWWIGSSPDDLHEYLSEYASDGYAIDAHRPSDCECGGNEFLLEFDSDEGAALRTCVACKEKHYICDSEEYWDEAEPENWKCVCGAETSNIGVGFSLYDIKDGSEEEADVRWLYIGTRCAKCDVLGCPAEWKVGYGPSHDLLEQA